jgi:hypothetical protein
MQTVKAALQFTCTPGTRLPRQRWGAGGVSDSVSVERLGVLTMTKTKITPRDRDSFVIRICREEGQPGWHGWVQHARSHDEAVFCNVDDLLRFIERRAGRLNGGATKKGLK